MKHCRKSLLQSPATAVRNKDCIRRVKHRFQRLQRYKKIFETYKSDKSRT